MEPTEPELRAFSDINAVMEWAGLNESAKDALKARLGATGSEHPRLIGTMPSDEFSSYIESTVISDQPLVPIQRRACLLFGHVCRLAIGTAKTAETLRAEAAANAKANEDATADALQCARKAAEEARKAAEAAASAVAATGSASTNAGAIELSSVTSQVSKEIVGPLLKEDVDNHYTAYKEKFGLPPDPNSECSEAQLAGLYHVLRSGGPPYVDFGVWGPNHHRLLRRMRFTGLRLGPAGSYHNVELLGPPDFRTWAESYDILMTGLLGFKAVELGNLLNYRRKMEGYWNLYGDATWSLQYQADVRCRLEHMERVRRNLAANAKRATEHGVQLEVTYDAKKPWDSVWAAAIDDAKFWTEELERPATLVLARAQSLAEHVDGDAPIIKGIGGGDMAQGSQRDKRAAPATVPERRVKSRPDKVHAVAEGLFTQNRRGFTLCAGFQNGSCVNQGPGIRCEKDSTMSHQCAKCLDPKHGATDCKAAPKEPSALPRRGDKGRGKGKKTGRNY